MVISYWYDAGGNRVGKTVSGKTGNPDSTWYVRDASGNVMSVYTKGNTAVNSGNLTQSETDIYGSSRLGMIQPAVNVQNWAGLTTLTISGYGSSGYFSSFTRGNKRYELSNHLGNVLAVVSDRKTAVGSGSVVNYYKAEVVSAQDYYPFGMQQKERTYYGDTSTVLYAGDGSSYVPSNTPEYVAQYESSTTGNYPYVDSSALRDNNITGGKWTNSQGGWTTYNGQSGRALAISSATPTTTTLTFEYDVATGYKMSAASFSFYQRASSTGYSQYTLSINGTQVGSGNLFVDAVGQDNPLQWTGDQTLTTAMNNLTGHVTVVITLSGGTHGSQGTFRLDNFSLNGYTVPTSYSNTAPNLYIHKYNYRYGFNGKENDNEVKGEGDEQDYGERIYDSRISKWLSVDPLQRIHPNESPYVYTGNNPILFVDPNGKDKVEYIRVITDQGTLLKTVVTKHAFKAEMNENYNTSPTLYKYDYTVHTTIDLRSGVPENKQFTTKTETDYTSSKKIGFVDYLKIKATGNDGPLVNLPQVVIYGSGLDDPGWGSKADPDRPVISIDFKEFNKELGLIMTGMSVPDLKGAGWKKVPGLIDKLRKEEIARKEKELKEAGTESNSNVTENSSNQENKPEHKTTLITVDTMPDGLSPQYDGPWGHYHRDEKGNTNDTIFKKKKQ